MSDRIVVMWDGRISGELPAGASEEGNYAPATGHQDENGQHACLTKREGTVKR
jgi:hypothetical protein